MGPSPHLWIFCIQNSGLSTRITSLYGSQTSPVDLCMQNSVLTTRIYSLYGSQTSPVDLCMKTACLPQDLQVSMGPRPPLWICDCKTVGLVPD